uniref:DUF218 domain-containing protein n=1 Tax=Oncorhynchus tshawytscha TaxID=74940 RepID=A0A8C8F276_ONCTS
MLTILSKVRSRRWLVQEISRIFAHVCFRNEVKGSWLTGLRSHLAAQREKTGIRKVTSSCAQISKRNNCQKKAGVWTRPEADVFLDAALRMGVPSGNILLETEATNTGENIRFSYRLLKENNIPAHRVILVQRPFTERRVFATFLRQWHDQEEHTHAIVISSQMGISAYPHPTVGTATDLITCMLGVLERIRDNPQKGFQVEQEIQDSLSRTGLSLPTNGSCTLATFPSECTTHTPMHERLHTLPRTHTCPYVLLC